MKAEWATYLKSIGIEGLFLERVEKVLDFYQQVYPDQIDDIFVTEYFDKDKNRQYESVWLFSDTTIMEAKQFLNEDNFDSTFLKQHVKYWSIKKEDYEFQEATTKSRMTLTFVVLSGASGVLKASRENCEHLKKIFLKHIIPNEIKYSVATQQTDAGDGR